MGQVILCHPYKATTPYVISYTGTRVYTYEELCYFICDNLDLMDNNIMDVSLVSWMKEQLNMKDIAEKLSAGLKNNIGYTGFLSLILGEGGFLDDSEMRSVISQLSEISKMSSDEKIKHQADKYLNNKKYSLAFVLYLRLAEKLEKDEKRDNKKNELYGDILHDMGVIYANMFMFELAADYFKKAYRLNLREESNIAANNASEMALKDRYEFVNAGKETLIKQYGTDADVLDEVSDIVRQAFGMCEHGTF